MKNLILCIALFGAMAANATDYYVSSTGNDSNNGTSTSTPWKTLDKLNASFSILKPADRILLKRGDVFYGSINVKRSGTSGSPIVFGAYGTGQNPVITGLSAIDSWVNLGNNIWESGRAVSSLPRTNMVLANGSFALMGRYPNTGWATYQSQTISGDNEKQKAEIVTIESSDLTGKNWTGAEIFIYANRYAFDKSTIQSATANKVSFPSVYRPVYDQKDPRFIIQNDPRTLDSPNEWYYNPSTKKLQIYSTSEPKNIRIATVDNLVNIYGYSYITFENISFYASNSNAIQLENSQYITIRNCDMDYSGQDAINGKGLQSSAGLSVDNCSIDHVNNYGIRLNAKYINATIQNSSIKNIGIIPGMTGISAMGIDAQGATSLISYNRLDSLCYVGIQFLGDHTVVNNNFVTNFNMWLTDGGGIYTWNGWGGTVKSGIKISNNIIINQNTNSMDVGIYLDDWSNNIEVQGNTVKGCGWGISGGNVFEVSYLNNTSFDNAISQITLKRSATQPVAGKVGLDKVVVKNNIFFVRVPNTKGVGSHSLFITDGAKGSQLPTNSIFDNNYYVSPVYTKGHIYSYFNSAGSNRYLSNWQSYFGQDKGSRETPKVINSPDELRFEYNATKTNKTIALDANYIDARGVNYNGTITLAPYTSAVLIRNGATTNQAPTANAGNNQTITLPINRVTLSGSGADIDGTITKYEWTKTSGPVNYNIFNANTAKTDVTGLTEGTYQFTLKVTDNKGATATSTVQITVNEAINIVPTANAGNNQSVTLPVNSITLNGTGTDTDGTITKYEWTKTAGPVSYNIVNPNTARTDITGLTEGTYQFTLKVTDDKGATATSTVQITVNEAINVVPTANAGNNQSITLPINRVTLSGSGIDTDGTITKYEWTKTSGPAGAAIANPGSASTSVNNLTEGVFQFTLKVTDNKGATATSTVQVTVNEAINIVPTASAGNNQSITLPVNSITLSGTGADTDGTITKYEWTKTAGPAGAMIANAASASTSVNNLTEGVYEFTLKVTDNKGATATSTVQITVNEAINVVPTANAGNNQSVTLPVNSITLNGTGTDTDGTITKYEWTKTAGPVSYNIVNPNTARTDITGLTEGVYQFTLKVTDNKGATATSTVEIRVNEAINIVPTASAGNNQTITLPINRVTLSGTGTDTDGTITKYEWTKTAGPVSYNIVNPNTARTDITGLTEGVYQFTLKVTDNKGATATSTVQITVNEAINIVPTASAGNNQTITLPINRVTLSGTGVDTDGTITKYEWTKTAGPVSYNIVNPNTARTDVTGLTEGTYQFTLKVTDNKGAAATSTVEITVNEAINVAPTVTAGNNQTITLPINRVTLSGTGVDTDGTITKYEWTKTAGPVSYNIVNANTAKTDVTGLTEGTYEFTLKVTDNKGATATSTVQVTVNEAINIVPTANAGNNQAITLPISRVTLSGSGTDTDGTITKYEWTKISGPVSYNIVNANTARTDVTGLAEGIYEFTLKVTDNKGATATSTVQITVNEAINIVPTASAGNNQSITLPINRVTLSGTGTDTDGTITKYEWTKTAGPAGAMIANAALASTSVNNLTEGVYQFTLKVTDNKGATATSTVEITVNEAINIVPTATAGNNQTITLPINRVTLSGTGVDTDGTITKYEWTKISGPVSYNIVNANTAKTDVTGLTEGTYEFTLKVTDNKGATATSTVQITVNEAINIVPTANAGNNQSVTLPVNGITLNGSGTDTDGTITKYEWTKISGPVSYNIVNANTARTDVTGLAEGIYEFTLKVTDNKGATATSTVQITVNEAINVAPTATAGNNQTITLPVNSITLNGSGADTDGTITKYEWTKISGPVSYNIVNPNTARTDITGLTEGTYEFTLKVTDNKGATAISTVQIIVNEAINIVPTVSAGNNQTITLPINRVTLSGTGTDTDGTITKYEWTKTAGPVSYNIVNPNTARTDVTGLTEGTYEFILKVTDNKGATATSTVQVTVNEAINVVPTANAGNNQSVTLPVNSITLNGSGTDTDGTITKYEWTKTNGPVSYNIVNPNTAKTDIIGLTEGVYQFTLKVTDNKGATATSTVQVTVNEAINIVPTVSAGNNQTITLPINRVTLSGTGTDTDGTITKYEWTKTAGPVSYNIVNPNTARTDITGLTEGTYEFTLKVTDNKGATAISTVQIIVNEAINIVPTVSAGNNQTITLPINRVTLSGTGTDTDGTITKYEWTKTAGPVSYNIVNPNTARTDVTGLTEGTYQFTLKVTDNKGATATSTVQVTVNEAINVVPTANAGNNQSVTLPVNSITLNGSGTDTDGTITKYEWTKISGPVSYNIVNPNTARTDVTGLTEGIYEFTLKVTDNKGATATSTVEITVNEAVNVAPTATAGNNQTIILPINRVTLSGTGTDTDGTITKYEWTKTAGPVSYNIVNPNTARTDITGLTEGTYEFTLKVTDNKGATATSTVQITVNEAINVVPTANAGNNQSVTLPVNSITLNGSGADTDGTITKYEWTKTAGPAGAVIANGGSASTRVNNLTEGVYQFTLKVTDNKGATATSTVEIRVNEAINIVPTASAGNNQTITLPINRVTLSGTGTDTDGTITKYEWTKTAGPVSYNIVNANTARTDITGLTEGVYQFTLKVTDNKGATATSTVQITVNEAINVVPTANAGNNQSVTLPVNSITLNGSGTDTDGTITKYEWTKTNGPVSYNIVNPNTARTDVTGLTEGTYEFTLKVTDNKGATATSTAQVTVNEAINIVPTASAGNNQSITLPINSITLSGTGADTDGTITKYEWTKTAGPAGAMIANAGSASTRVNNLTEGVYQFTLKVTDNKGATATSTVEITVNPTPNVAPVASAGFDQSITLPVNKMSLAGSGADSDGKIVSYIWSKISGPASFVIVNPNSPVTDVTDLQQGIYQFELQVTDNRGTVSKDTMQVTVRPAINIAPKANAGVDKTISTPVNTITLAGSAIDIDGAIVKYEWKQVAGPSTSTIVNPASAETVVNDLTAGTYRFELTVTDNSEAIDKDTMELVVALGRLASQPNSLKVYPNPVKTTTSVEINTTKPTNNVAMVISSANGKVVYKKTFSSVNYTTTEKINMSKLTKGFYTVTVYFDGKSKQSLGIVKL